MKRAVKIPVVLVLILLAGGISYDMLRRAAVQELWGYEPLFLFMALWGVIVLLLEKRFSAHPHNGRLLLLSSGSGVLLALGFPGLIPFPLLMLVGFVPLLLVERAVTTWRGGPARWTVFKYSFHTFVVWNILTTYWVGNTAFVAGVFAILANSLLMTIPFVLFHQTRQVLPRLGYPAFIAYWLSFEYGHLQWELTWPWLTLGNSFAEFPSWIQWYEYTGHLGGSLWVLLANILALRAYLHFQDNEKPAFRGAVLRLTALVVLPVTFSLWEYYNQEERGEVVEVVIVQPNYEPHYEKFAVSEREQVERFLSLAGPLMTDTTEYVLFPETVFGWVEATRMDEYPTVRRIREFFADHPGLEIISGANVYYDYEPDYPHGRATRERELRTGEKVFFETYNAAVQITIGEEQIDLYKKSKLVPGPEIFPYPDFFFFAKPLVDRLEGTIAGVATQPERSVFSSETGRIGPVICYESVFGEYAAGYIRKGAEALFIMTNDGWWDNTAGHRQHLHFASLRAIESRRAIARSANTGISAFINQRGDILEATRYDEPAAIRGDIRLNQEITLYVRYGDLVARIALFVTILLLLNTFVKGLIKGRPTR